MIIDAHTHLGSTAQFYIPDVSPSRMLALMDFLGIGVMVQSHNAGFTCGDYRIGYEESIAAWAASNGRICALAVFNPQLSEISLEWSTRSLDHEAFVGLKIHPSIHRLPAEDPAFEPAWKLAAERGVPILTHSWDKSDYNPVQELSMPQRFATWVERYPNVPFILGHAGGRHGGHRAAIRLAQAHANVFMDLAGDVYTGGLVEALVRQVGAERVMFASDMTWIDPRPQLGCILGADISPEAKAKILGENAVRLFGLQI